MKKRILSFLLAVCVALSIAPMPAYAEDVPNYYCGEEHTHTDTCLVNSSDQTVMAPAPEEEPQEDTQTCTCETACTTEAMNQDCAICGAEGAAVENCGKYVAPAVCTCETACTTEAMNQDCTICGAEGAAVEDCAKYAAPVSYTVTFHVGEHGTAPENQTVTEGSAVTKPADPTADGYIFDGWYADAELTTAWDFENNTVAQDTTLYAKWKEDTAAVDSDGDGYVEIDSAAKLWWFTQQVNGGNKSLNAELTADIDLAGTCGEGIGNWQPIGNKYSGHFNGQGFTVSNLYIESDEQYAGLFGYVKSGTIENVTVTGNVSSTFYWTYDPDTYESFDGAAGGVVAHLDGGTIRNCESTVTVTGGYEFGGICGLLSSGIIEDCINRGTIICFQDSTNQVEYAGIVGHLNEGTVRGCTNHGEVTVGTRQNYVDNVGGIVARSSYGTIENCINMSSIVGSNTSTGGIVGKNWVYATVRNCGNLGTVTGDYAAGGITGVNEGIIEHCWDIASVSGTSEYVGPVAGYISTNYGNITNNYYLSDTETDDGGRTAEQFASGQVAYELNGSTTAEDNVWRQTIGTDAYPVFDGLLVYYGESFTCDGTSLGVGYSNTAPGTLPDHSYGEYGLCTVCRHSGTPAEDTDGDGYVEIDSAAKLWWFTQQVNGGNNSLNAELTANIDLSGTCGEGIGNWQPIGNKYSGHFNGQGYTISNLYMSGDDQYIGLFGRVYGATIENVTVIGSVSSTFSYFLDPDNYVYLEGAAGGIVAYMDDGTIRNCHVDMSVVSGGFEIGGICGTMYDGLIEGCTVNGNIICKLLPDQGSGSYIGGIVGCTFGGTIRGCVNRAAASAENSVHFGGIAGLGTGDAIKNCLNYGTFNAIYDSTYAGGTTAGGIVGSSMTVIRGCGNLGSINISGSGEWTGGIVGFHQTSSSIVENCYNVGSITSSDGKFGVIVGATDTSAIVTNNYYLNDTATEDGGRTAAQFASGQVTYELNGSTTAEDNVWRQTIGTDAYPVLSGALVYCVSSQKCDGTVLESVYSNASETVIIHEDADADGFCDLCGWLIISEKTFPDETFRNIISSAEFDVNQDGLLSPEEIASVTFLQLENTGLTDVTGIHYFTELTDILAYDNDLKTLDLSGLSKLENLYLQDNYNLASLNLEGCSSLRELCLSGCTALASLKMEDCKALDYLDLSYCYKLQDSLDVSHLTELIYLCVDGIGLRELDLSANTKLEELSVRNTGLTWLDLSNTAVYRLEGMAYLPIKHCGVGYVNMKDLVKDTANIVNITGGTLGADGWLKLDDNADLITYEYVTGAEGCNLSVTIYFNQNYVGKHTYIDQPVCKDEAGHYTRICSTCRTIDETSYEPCVYDNACDTDCNVCGAVREITHSYDSDCDTQCNICGEIRTVTHPYVNGFCTTCGIYEEPELVEGVYQIANSGNLFWFAKTVNDGDSDAKALVIDDIDLENREWSPIDNFSGEFDGGGHSITGLLITAPANRMAFFGRTISPAVIQNFTISGLVKPTSGGDWYLGGVAVDSGDNEVYNGSTISNVICYVDLDASAGKVTRMGGIVTSIYGGNVLQCLYLGTIQGSANDVGGIVGYARQGRIENCGMAGSVSSSNYVGGILGYVNNNATYVKNCYVFGSVQSTNATRVGAIIGRARSNFDITKADNNYYNGALTTGAFGTECEVTFGESAATDKTAEAFYSGEVAWLLNGESSDGLWRQTLDGESLPGFSGEPVYYNTVYSCDGTASREYSNTQVTDSTIPDHQLDGNGTCQSCGQTFQAMVILADETVSYFETLTQALSAVSGQTDATVKLLANLTQALTIRAGAFRLDLNGRTLSSEYIEVLDTADVTICSSAAGGLLDCIVGVTIDGGALTMESGTLRVTEGPLMDLLAGSLHIAGGELVHQTGKYEYGMITGYGYTIGGGVFQSDQGAITLYGMCTISGGTFLGGIDSGSTPIQSKLVSGAYLVDENGHRVTLAQNQTFLEGTVTVRMAGSEVISVDITWGDLSFTYSDGTWNPDTLTYDDRGWTVDTEGGNVITVTNSGDEAITVSVSYAPAEGYTGVSGSFGETTATLAGEEEKKFWLLLSGKPENEMSGVPLGTVTVTIGGE